MDLNKNIKDCPFVFLDLETTGLDAVTGDSICEIGILKVQGGEVVDTFHSLINPKKSMPFQAYQVHKISDEALKTAPYFEDVAENLIAFLKDYIVCAYNVSFDMGFIKHHLERMNFPIPKLTALDVLSMARDVLKLSRYNLEAAAQFFNIGFDSLHRAFDDAEAAYKVFFKLIDIFKGKGIERLEEFIKLYGLEDESSILEENKKIILLKQAVESNSWLKMKYFYSANIEEGKIMPLRVSEEKKCFYLWFQTLNSTSRRIKLNRILDMEA
ncbi:MAG: 3'-5' exonuclease [Candidatus Omnitrophota bacterium]